MVVFDAAVGEVQLGEGGEEGGGEGEADQRGRVDVEELRLIGGEGDEREVRALQLELRGDGGDGSRGKLAGRAGKLLAEHIGCAKNHREENE